MRRSVSYLLCVCMLFSVLAVSFCGSVSAESTSFSKTYYNTTQKVKLTFDGEDRFGLPLSRGSVPVYIYDKETDSGYATHTIKNKDGSSFWLGKNGYVGEYPLEYDNAEDLFYFLPGITYSLKYKCRGLVGTTTADKMVRSVSYLFSSNPESQAEGSMSNYELIKSTTVISNTGSSMDFTYTAKDEAGILTENSEWTNVELVFTIKTTYDDGTTVPETGLALGLRCLSGSSGAVANIGYDDIVISEVDTTCSYVYSEAFHTMEDPVKDEIITTKYCSEGTCIEDNYDADHGSVIKLIGDANGRLSFEDFDVKENRKYFISYDAKCDTANSKLITVIGANGSSTVNCRFFFTGANTRDDGIKYFIDGEPVAAKNFKTSTEWRHYGIIIDTSDPNLHEQILVYNEKGTFWTKWNIHFLFGVNKATAYFDNIRLIEIQDVPDAVPDEVTVPKASGTAGSIRYHEDATDTEAFVSAGLRFRFSVTNEQKEKADEIGFLVTPSLYAAKDPDWYDFNAEGGLSKMAKKAVCYSVAGKKDVVYRQASDSTQYQMILTGLSNADETKTAYNTRYITVMYIKSGETYQYFTVGELSFNQIRGAYIVQESEPDVITPDIK